ncbi:MAG: c-type cytochrome [Gammaproteobacteria bacterium]
MRKPLTTIGAVLLLAAASAGAEDVIPALDSNQCAPAMDESLRGDAAAGDPLHKEHCVACHGLTGAADVVVMHMDETPPDQSDPEYMKNLPDAYLYLAICRGGEGIGKSYIMSPWGDFFSDQQIRDLVAFIRTFSDT